MAPIASDSAAIDVADLAVAGTKRSRVFVTVEDFRHHTDGEVLPLLPRLPWLRFQDKLHLAVLATLEHVLMHRREDAVFREANFCASRVHEV